MPNTREVRLRIRSIKNIAQVTRALQAVSTSKVRRSVTALMHTQPYATKAWEVLTHIASQPGRDDLHPLLSQREKVSAALLIVITSDRGLAGAYNTNVIRFTLQQFSQYPYPLRYIAVGRKGRDLLLRLRKEIIAEFSNLPTPPTFKDVSAIGMLAIEEFLSRRVDEVFLIYTDFVNMVRQTPTVKKLLPLEYRHEKERVGTFDTVTHQGSRAVYIYEPDMNTILNRIVPRFTELQVYQAILEAQASEHAARMIAMKNATDAATELAASLQLEYNKARQQAITSEMLDIAGGAEALSIQEKVA
ncbi:MAG: ATP synthase F1 subunit gamma [Anaerolineales bacterium]|nr:ATP synthase F1 subunit gamma [Anaerolineales bacterium]MDW8446804.1 ATP synthase F1 subunit gamma [Anaerolineales bacterium]